ncbi:MAG: hypothetical protein WEH44_07880 [Pirellulaceae bacterium]
MATGGTNLSKLVERADESAPSAKSAYWPAIRAVGQAVHLAETIDGDAPPRQRDSATHFLLPSSDAAYLGSWRTLT